MQIDRKGVCQDMFILKIGCIIFEKLYYLGVERSKSRKFFSVFGIVIYSFYQLRSPGKTAFYSFIDGFPYALLARSVVDKVVNCRGVSQ